jgi:hypothetical protein
MPESCENCRFWLRDDDVNSQEDGDGECRKSPPTIVGSSWTGGRWTVTNEVDWCGEWQEARCRTRSKAEVAKKYGVDVKDLGL